jgi:probable F420-dependent oxidoreductase
MGSLADPVAPRITARYGIDVGVAIVYTEPLCQATMIRAICESLEAEGVESVWAAEHTVVPEHYTSSYPYSADRRIPGGPLVPVMDPLILLATIGAQTSHVRLGTGIAILPQRNPVIFAKEAATLDVLSDGRLELGVGVGWLREEFDAVGASFADRGSRADEYIRAMRTLWTTDETFSGQFVSFSDARCYPKPVNKSIPILVAGHSAQAARRAARLGDGFFVAEHRGVRQLVDIFRDEATKNGREPSNLRLMTYATRDVGALRELHGLGVSRLVLRSPLPIDPGLFAEALRHRLLEFEQALVAALGDAAKVRG